MPIGRLDTYAQGVVKLQYSQLAWQLRIDRAELCIVVSHPPAHNIITRWMRPLHKHIHLTVGMVVTANPTPKYVDAQTFNVGDPLRQSARKFWPVSRDTSLHGLSLEWLGMQALVHSLENRPKQRAGEAGWKPARNSRNDPST